MTYTGKIFILKKWTFLTCCEIIDFHLEDQKYQVRLINVLTPRNRNFQGCGIFCCSATFLLYCDYEWFITTGSAMRLFKEDVMQRLDLVKFLTDNASELLGQELSTDGFDQARQDEAAELLNLSARILARSDLVVIEKPIQEAA